MALEIECVAEPAEENRGSLTIGGAADYEEFDLRGRKLGRKSTVFVSVDNVCCAFKKRFCVDCAGYHVRFNVPGGIPMDGPSAGIAFAVALMSALTGKAAEPGIALTGEITAHGEVRAVGGVREKILAAKAAGADTVVIPKANWENGYEEMGVNVVSAEDISEVMRTAFNMPLDTRNDAFLPFLCTTA